jgi:Tfp pilus assembly protein PilX
MTTSRHDRRGYVLVVTLGLLVLSTTLLVAVGRVAVHHALAAREAADELQRHWGAVSCRNAVLPFAEQILSQAEAEQHRPVPIYRANLQLGGQTFAVILSDEQAKANVNDLMQAASGSKSAVESKLRESFIGAGLSNSIRLRPALLLTKAGTKASQTQPSTTQPGTDGGVPRWITGFGQIFDNVPPERLLGGSGQAPVDRITCWGGGGTNVMRASVDAMKLAAGSYMSGIDIGRLIDIRNGKLKPRTGSGSKIGLPALAGAAPNGAGTDPMGRLLAEAKITVKNRAKMPLLAGSACHSVWIIVRDPRRPWYYLVVSDESNPQKTRIESFVW